MTRMTYEPCTIPPGVDAAIRAAVGIPAHIRIDLHITPEDIPVRGMRPRGGSRRTANMLPLSKIGLQTVICGHGVPSV